MNEWKKHIKELIHTDINQASELIINAIRRSGFNQDLLFETIVLRQNLLSTSSDSEVLINNFREDLIKIVSQLEDEKIKGEFGQDEKKKNLSELFQVKKEVVFKGEKVWKKYQKFDLSNINIKLKTGEITALVGENGAGKTTLLEIIAGVIPPDNGNIEYPKFSKSKKDKDWLSIKNNIAYISQQLEFWETTLLVGLKLEASIHGIRGKTNELETQFIIERLGLREHIGKSWSALSSGYKLRFALAKALIWKPKLLILDEPLGNLDILVQMTILNDLKQLTRSLKYPISILISSQHITEIEEVADNIVFLKKGSIEYSGSLKDIGKQRKGFLFEFECEVSFEKFYSDFYKTFPNLEVKNNSTKYLISSPEKISTSKILEYFILNKIELISFRNLTNSSKRIFYEK